MDKLLTWFENDILKFFYKQDGKHYECCIIDFTDISKNKIRFKATPNLIKIWPLLSHCPITIFRRVRCEKMANLGGGVIEIGDSHLMFNLFREGENKFYWRETEKKLVMTPYILLRSESDEVKEQLNKLTEVVRSLYDFMLAKKDFEALKSPVS